MTMLAPTTHILPLATVTEKRMLPIDGRIIAHVGQKVSPQDVVAEAAGGFQYYIVDVAQILHISVQKASNLITVKRGQKVAKDDALVEAGALSRETSSPVEGRVAAIGGGKIIIESGGGILELRAGITGVVSEIVGERGVTIQGTGAIVQGVWGNGCIESGLMFNLLEAPDDVLDPARLDVSLRGSILLGGYLDNPTALKNAAEVPVRGLILSSMSPGLAQTALQVRLPIILTEGFGRRPMNSTAYKLLTTNTKRDVSLNAAFFDRTQGTRPEVFVPLPVSQDPPEPHDVEAFTAGQTVRVVFLAQASQLGNLERILPGFSTLPNGVKAPAANVRLESGETIVVPLTNLEVLG